MIQNNLVLRGHVAVNYKNRNRKVRRIMLDVIMRSTSSGLENTTTIEPETVSNVNLNLSLIGPPGSGKGSYGKKIAEALQIQIYTVSDLLRKFRPDVDISSGKLIDDFIVGETILNGIRQHHNENYQQHNGLNDDGNNNYKREGYIIDGFPRTLQQVKLMKETWPELFWLKSAVHLNVPDEVCKSKLLGRRSCSNCGVGYNVNGVDWNGWLMPPNFPAKGHICVGDINKNKIGTGATVNDDDDDVSFTSNNHNNNQQSAVAACDWSVQREDDTPDIIGNRLKIYHQNADPILDYFKKRNRLLTLTPYHGFDDLPKIINRINTWIDGNKNNNYTLTTEN
mmetsp:Transcript_48716/g.54499  ORF Transcript_48716/g.54499 Transcript_48716/m.54499 type:complete len:338 (+) Transcript_48716:41-1054(+)